MQSRLPCISTMNIASPSSGTTMVRHANHRRKRRDSFNPWMEFRGRVLHRSLRPYLARLLPQSGRRDSRRSPFSIRSMGEGRSSGGVAGELRRGSIDLNPIVSVISLIALVAAITLLEWLSDLAAPTIGPQFQVIGSDSSCERWIKSALSIAPGCKCSDTATGSIFVCPVSSLLSR